MSTDETRRRAGFLTAAELMKGLGRENEVLDPGSILVSRSVRMGRGNRLYPGTVIEAGDDGSIEIGDGNRFGPGGCTILAHGAAVRIGDRGRYSGGASIEAPAELGSGSQVLGPIAARGCTLGAGGDHASADPDARGGVLKGVGRAHGMIVPQGKVIAGEGRFDQSAIQPQSFYHPPPASRP